MTKLTNSQAGALVLLAVLGAPALIALMIVLRGFVLVVLWRWFAIPLGAPALTIPLAIGVALVAAFLTHQSGLAKEKTEWWDGLVSSVLQLGLFLLTGWIVTLFM